MKRLIRIAGITALIVLAGLCVAEFVMLDMEDQATRSYTEG